MNRLLLTFIFLAGLSAAAQDFRFESRFYLLQNYIRQYAIKTITLGRSEDSLVAWKVEGLKLEFDSLGRLAMIEEPFNTKKSRRVIYTYEGYERAYSTKEYLRQDDSSGNYEPFQKWEIITKEDQTQTNEVLRFNHNNADDTLRKNLVLYDNEQRIYFRSTCPDQGNIITSKFSYNKQGFVSQFITAYCAQQNPDSCFGGEAFDFSYDENGRISSISGSKRSAGNVPGISRQISFQYSDAGIAFITDSSSYEAKKHGNYEFVTRYNGRVDFHTVSFNEKGLVSVIRKCSSYSKSTSYLTFSYTFYDGPRVRASSESSASEFLLYYFAPFDWMRMY
jgi:hypothetical protein